VAFKAPDGALVTVTWFWPVSNQSHILDNAPDSSPVNPSGTQSNPNPKTGDDKAGTRGGTPLIPDKAVGFELHMDINGKTEKELNSMYNGAVSQIVKSANLPKEYSDQAMKLIHYYIAVFFANDKPDAPYDFMFEVSAEGNVTEIDMVYNAADRRPVKREQPRLSFVEFAVTP
jgi:hypothetical protein